MSDSRVIFITGASSGIGAAIAVEYATRLNCKLALFARRKDRLEEVAKECKKFGRETLLCVGDVTDITQVETAMAQVKRAWGSIDTVYANAGFGIGGKVEKLSVEDFRHQYDVNFFGVLNTFKAAQDDLKKTQGRLCLIGSVLSYISLPRSAPYCSSKFAVKALADSLWFELKPYGITTTLICPGIVESEIRVRDPKGNEISQTNDKTPGWIRMKTPKAARQIVDAVEDRKREKIITIHGMLGVFLIRYMPWVVRFFVGRVPTRGVGSN